MFISKLGKAVIGADKEVVPGDMMLLVEGRPVTRHGECQHIPLLLDDGGEFPPGGKSAKMNLLLLKLRSRSGKYGMCAILPEADSVLVEEGDFSYRGPAITEACIWKVSRHFSLKLLNSEVTHRNH